LDESLTQDRAGAEELGSPLPANEHAVSVSLPLWEHNVGYEEGDPQVVGRMRSGYPRFFLHPLVVRLFDECTARFAKQGECCFAFPSRRVADTCATYVQRHTGHSSRVISLNQEEVCVVCLPTEAAPVAKEFWQHAGEIVSSRLAAAVLAGAAKRQADAAPNSREAVSSLAGAAAEKLSLKQRIAAAVECDPGDVYLFPTGMAAVYTAYRAFQRLRPGRRSIQYGFPYVDILKVQQRFADADGGVALYPHGTADELAQVEQLLQAEAIMGLFCEFPGNPLLRSPDLKRLAELARRHRFPLLVDDTLGAFINVNALPAADVLANSLTKFFSGRGDVMGGSLVLNARGPFYRELQQLLDAEYEDLLFAADAVVLERNSRDFRDRVARINRTAERLCDHLRQHPAVAHVYYPNYETPDNYRAFQRPGGGFGGLFSLLLHDSARTAPACYDALRICKGPNLGTNFSLCCPYTLLAHYHELEFAESCGVSRYLLRVSVGLEDADWLIARFDATLAAANRVVRGT
jgi:cystathionine gamma-synthase